MTVDSETPALGDFEYEVPEALTQAQYDEVLARFDAAIASNFDDPLSNLDTQHRDWMMAYAYHQPDEIPPLERILRGKMAAGGYPRAVVNRFKLTEFVRAATRRQRLVRDERERRQRLARSQLRVLEGGRNARRDGGTRETQREVGNLSVAAMLETDSPHLIMVGHLLQRRQGRIWRDAFYGDNFSDWVGDDDDRPVAPFKVDDQFMRKVHTWLLGLDLRLAKLGIRVTELAVAYVAELNSKNEPKDWMTSLVWDGENRLDKLMPLGYGTPDDDYHRAVGRCWMMSMAARILRPGEKVDTMPVFFGGQGKMKSTSLERLGGKWYRPINVPAHSKDFEDSLRGVMLGEIQEMDAIASNKVDVARVKALLSTRIDRYRPSYGRVTVDFPRTCVLAGSTNTQDWHRDETGGRRFWPLHVSNIDLVWLVDNRDQLFAEAVARVQRGEPWWDVPEEEQAALVAQHYVSDPWESLFASYLDAWTRPGREQCYDGWNGAPRVAGKISAASDEEKWGTLITMERLAGQALGIPKERWDRRLSTRAAKIMRGLGWDYIRVRPDGSMDNADRVRAWVLIARPVTSREAEPSSDDDIPF